MTSCDHSGPCTPVPTQLAAQAVRVEPVTIRTWAHRGWITARGLQGRQQTWCLQEVRAAEVREQRRAKGLV